MELYYEEEKQTKKKSKAPIFIGIFIPVNTIGHGTRKTGEQRHSEQGGRSYNRQTQVRVDISVHRW